MIRQPFGIFQLSRRLFQHSPQTGEVSLRLGQVPSLTLKYVSPSSTTEEIAEAIKHGLPSVSGFRQVVVDHAYGVTLNDILPKFFGELGMTVTELSTRFKLGAQLGFEGPLVNAGLSWVGEHKQAHFETVVSRDAVMANIEYVGPPFPPGFADTDALSSLMAWGQQLTIPVILSTSASERSPTIALCAFVLPSIASVLSYQFFILPRRRARRIE